MSKRKILTLALMLCMIAILAIGGTLAYFTAEETARNVITTGNLNMDLVEETSGGKPFPQNGIGNVMPGQAVDKIVYLKNSGNVAFYGRISLEKTISGGLSLDGITMDINTENWTEKDGHYYYNAAIQPGKKTEPLFTKVSFDAGLGNAYQNAKVEIDVRAQAVQCANNGSDPLSATGWE